MSFHTQNFQTRFGTMGDTAEAVFDLLFPANHPLGLCRPPFNVSGMPAPMRYAPDRMTRSAFVEIMGIGRDQTLKMKVEKLDALSAWRALGPVELFVFDSANRRYWCRALRDWDQAFDDHGTEGMFPEGKEYVGLHSDWFPGTPGEVSVEPAA
jgi:hypothetical protein